MKPRVLVLGCGPAGLIAAWTAQRLGGEVVIASRAEQSVIGGAQYLHQPVPGINTQVPDGRIQIIKRGTAQGYAQKVYGNPNTATSWYAFAPGEVRAWDLRRAYRELWDRLHGLIVPTEVNVQMMSELLAWARPDLVISSIPAPALCREVGQHKFVKRKVLIDMNTDLPEGDNVIVWNGDPDTKWYRASSIFQVTGGYEYPLGSILSGAHVARKPIGTNCNCWPEILRVGRYGKWDKLTLTHDAMYVVRDALGKIYA